MSLKKFHYIISDIISSITDELINKYSINSKNINKVITENQILFTTYRGLRLIRKLWNPS